MKTKRFTNKPVPRLNKTTIVNLNHREMVKIKVGTGAGAQVNTDSEAQYSTCCHMETVPHETVPNFSFVQVCKPLTGVNTACMAPATIRC